MEDRETRIEKAQKHLKSILKKKGLSPEKLKVAEGLITRIAFMQVSMEELEEDINQNGETEMFSQTPSVEYARERPSMAIYNRTVKNYISACKHLFDMLPEEKPGSGPSKEEQELLEMMKAARR